MNSDWDSSERLMNRLVQKYIAVIIIASTEERWDVYIIQVIREIANKNVESALLRANHLFLFVK